MTRRCHCRFFCIPNKRTKNDIEISLPHVIDLHERYRCSADDGSFPSLLSFRLKTWHHVSMNVSNECVVKINVSTKLSGHHFLDTVQARVLRPRCAGCEDSITWPGRPIQASSLLTSSVNFILLDFLMMLEHRKYGICRTPRYSFYGQTRFSPHENNSLEPSTSSSGSSSRYTTSV